MLAIIAQWIIGTLWERLVLAAYSFMIFNSVSLRMRGHARGRGGCDAQVAEECSHVGADLFVVLIDGCPAGGDMVVLADLDTGEDGRDDVVAEGEHGGDGARRPVRDVVAAGGALFGGAAGLGRPPRPVPVRRHPDRRDQPGLGDVDAARPVPVQWLVLMGALPRLPPLLPLAANLRGGTAGEPGAS
jgi:hypothetical protein